MSKKQEYLIIAGLLVLIFPFFALLFYVHPQVDDFFFAAKVNEMGVWAFVKDMYFHWSGRYASMFIGAFDPLRFDSLLLYRISLFFLQFVFLTSVFTFFKSIIIQSFSNSKLIIVTLFFYIIFINGVPSLLELFYWLPGASAYLLGLSLYLFFISNHFFNKSKRLSNILYLLTNIIVAFLLIGLLELFVLPLLTTQFLILFKSYKKKKKLNLEIIIFSLIIISSIITILAPGNYIRMNEYSQINEHVPIVILAIKSLVYVSGYYFQNSTFLIGSIIYIIIVIKLINNKNIFIFNLPNIKPFKLFGFLIFLLITFIYPATYSLHCVPPFRVLNYFSFFFFLFWFGGLILVINYHKNTFLTPFSSIVYIKILSVFFIISIFSGIYITDRYNFRNHFHDSIYIEGNILKSYFTLIFAAKKFNIEMTERTNILTKAFVDHKKTAKIQSLSFSPELLHFEIEEEKERPGIWIKSKQSTYYYLDSIYIGPRKRQTP